MVGYCYYRQIFLWWLLLFRILLPTSSQTDIIGRVVNKNHKGLSDISVRLMLPADSSIIGYGFTDEKGNYKLSYKEQRELEQLPQRLEDLEEKITALQAEIGDPNFFQQPHDVTDAKLKALADAEAELETAFMHWEELEEKKNLAEGK